MWNFCTLHILLLSIFWVCWDGHLPVLQVLSFVCLDSVSFSFYISPFLFWLLLCNVYEYELWKLQSHNDKDNDQRTRAWVFTILTVAFGTIFCSPFFVIRLRILKLSWGDFLLIFGGGVSEYLQAIFSGRWNSDRVSLCFLGSIYFKGGLTRFHKNSLKL